MLQTPSGAPIKLQSIKLRPMSIVRKGMPVTPTSLRGINILRGGAILQSIQ